MNYARDEWHMGGAAPMLARVDFDLEVFGKRAPVEKGAGEGGDGYREEGQAVGVSARGG